MTGRLVLALCLVLASGSAHANPIGDETAREINDLPARWLAHPTPQDAQGLIDQFGAYGIAPGLHSKQTFELLSVNFDRFAPLMVAGQRPPHAPDAELQAWFRARADAAQGAAMRRALREWLWARVTEPPLHGSMRIEGVGKIDRTRLSAAEALGDWGHPDALPDLRAFARKRPQPGPILATAIRRLEYPTWPAALSFESNGKVRLGRVDSEIESVLVQVDDMITRKQLTRRVGRGSITRLWCALAKGRAYRRGYLPDPPEMHSLDPRRLEFYFRGGEVMELSPSGSAWNWRERARPSVRHELANPDLLKTLIAELRPKPGSGARFIAETVELRIEPRELHVHGAYDFEGTPPDGWVPLIYPIATMKEMGAATIDRVALHSLDNGKSLPVSFAVRNGVCRISMSPGRVQAYRLDVHYRQVITGRAAAYLTTTARRWGRPLHRARFVVGIARSLGEPEFNAHFVQAGFSEKELHYSFEVSPYRPDRDIVVRW